MTDTTDPDETQPLKHEYSLAIMTPDQSGTVAVPINMPGTPTSIVVQVGYADATDTDAGTITHTILTGAPFVRDLSSIEQLAALFTHLAEVLERPEFQEQMLAGFAAEERP